MSIQPFRGTQRVVLEKRDANGSLDFTGEQAPHTPMTFDQVYDLYFRDNPDGVGTWDALRAWLDSKGWRIRAKTW
jgi:hypothetical protein